MVEGPACETTELQGLLCKKGGKILGWLCLTGMALDKARSESFLRRWTASSSWSAQVARVGGVRRRRAVGSPEVCRRTRNRVPGPQTWRDKYQKEAREVKNSLRGLKRRETWRKRRSRRGGGAPAASLGRWRCALWKLRRRF
jgi:hypothetical protein